MILNVFTKFSYTQEKILSRNVREIPNQPEPKESTNGYRKKGKTGDSDKLITTQNSSTVYFYRQNAHAPNN